MASPVTTVHIPPYTHLDAILHNITLNNNVVVFWRDCLDSVVCILDLGHLFCLCLGLCARKLICLGKVNSYQKSSRPIRIRSVFSLQSPYRFYLLATWRFWPVIVRARVIPRVVGTTIWREHACFYNLSCSEYA